MMPEMILPKNPYPESKGESILPQRFHQIYKEAQKAALRWFVEWGGENCPHREPNGWHLKHYCPKCWQQLELKLAELKE